MKLMPGEEGKANEFSSLVGTELAGALLAALFQAVRAFRRHGGEEFNSRRFITGLVSAGAIGAVAAWTLEAFGAPRDPAAVIVSMCGYAGGRLLDIIEIEIPETVLAAFEWLQRRLERGRWNEGKDASEIDGTDSDGDDGE